ncbi:srs domain-containing protein [Cystoisospora suis]|uniref:Srs domain-containing protein n=1 Tax=Cystoisospora suis TaxID=483139 RepID=A0A2C6KJE4_9APIC|nr:srs domain-containing protein [Cystoisospora suis]
MASPHPQRKPSAWMFTYLWLVLLPSPSTVCAVGAVNEGEPEKSSTIEGQVATCSAPHAETPKPATLKGSISQANPTFELVCKGENSNAVPSELANVCKQTTEPSARQLSSANTTSLSKCSEDAKQQCALSTLLFPGAKAAWTAATSETRDGVTQKKFQVTIPREEFPLVDQQFLVGCMEKSKPQSSCQVNITVNARASEVSADNVVTCAYGKDSNKAPVAVTLTPEKNSFTLKCGSEGARIPTEKQEYCSGTSIDGCSAKQLTSLIPKAEASWWTESDGQKTVQFTIPTDKFPSSDTVFLVGCKTAEKEKDATSCNVNVTVRSSAVSSFRKNAFSLGAITAVVLTVSCGLL